MKNSESGPESGTDAQNQNNNNGQAHGNGAKSGDNGNQTAAVEQEEKRPFFLSLKKNRSNLARALAVNKKQKCKKQFMNSLLSLDVFGQKVEFTFKGKRSFQTALGAFVSSIIMVILGFFIVYEFYVIFARKHPVLSVKELITNTPETPMTMNPFERGFEIALSLSTSSNRVKSILGLQQLLTLDQTTQSQFLEEELFIPDLRPEYGKLTANLVKSQIYNKYTDQEQRKETIIQLQLEKCKNSKSYNRYPFMDVTKSEEFRNPSIIESNLVNSIEKPENIQKYYSCIKDAGKLDNLQLTGVPNGVEYSYIKFQIEQCRNNSYVVCKSQDDIDNLFNEIRLNIIYVKSHLDFKDYKSPLKYFIEEPYTIQLESTREQHATMFIKHAQAEFYDNFFATWEIHEEQFYNIAPISLQSNRMESVSAGKPKVMASFKIRMDQKMVLYGRVSESVIKALEEIGGFFGSMIHIGKWLVIFFQHRLFKGSFIKQLYQITNEPKTQQKIDDKKRILKSVEQYGTLKDQHTKWILEHLIHRHRFKYTYEESIQYLLRCMCLRKKIKNKEEIVSFKRPHEFYRKGNKKLERELDVVNLIKSIRKLRMMSHVLLAPAERMMLKFQRRMVIETSSSSSDSDHHTYDTVKLLNSKKGLVKLQQLIKIKGCLDQYKDRQLEMVDRNLIKGIFQRIPTKKFIEDVPIDEEKAVEQIIQVDPSLAQVKINLLPRRIYTERQRAFNLKYQQKRYSPQFRRSSMNLENSRKDAAGSDFDIEQSGRYFLAKGGRVDHDDDPDQSSSQREYNPNFGQTFGEQYRGIQTASNYDEQGNHPFRPSDILPNHHFNDSYKAQLSSNLGYKRQLTDNTTNLMFALRDETVVGRSIMQNEHYEERKHGDVGGLGGEPQGDSNQQNSILLTKDNQNEETAHLEQDDPSLPAYYPFQENLSSASKLKTSPDRPRQTLKSRPKGLSQFNVSSSILDNGYSIKNNTQKLISGPIPERKVTLPSMVQSKRLGLASAILGNTSRQAQTIQSSYQLDELKDPVEWSFSGVHPQPHPTYEINQVNPIHRSKFNPSPLTSGLFLQNGQRQVGGDRRPYTIIQESKNEDSSQQMMSPQNDNENDKINEGSDQ